MNWDAIIWLILLVFFLLAEAFTVNLVSIWFAIGAFVALLISLPGEPIWLQILAFFAVSGAMLALLRPLLRRYIHPKITRTNVDGVIGATGLVTVAINNVTAQGQVKLGAMEWSARSITGDPIAVGTLVQVQRVEGVKVFVCTVKEPVANR